MNSTHFDNASLDELATSSRSDAGGTGDHAFGQRTLGSLRQSTHIVAERAYGCLRFDEDCNQLTRLPDCRPTLAAAGPSFIYLEFQWLASLAFTSRTTERWLT